MPGLANKGNKVQNRFTWGGSREETCGWFSGASNPTSIALQEQFTQNKN